MQMADSMFKIKPLKVEIIKCILRQLSRECADFSSKKSPSILRKNNTDDMRLLELKKVCDEFQERAPLFYSMLLTCAVPNGRKQTETIKWLPSVPYETSRSAADLQQICFDKNRSSAD